MQAAAELERRRRDLPDLRAHGGGLEALVDHLGSLLPEGPFFFPPEDRSDQAEEVLLAELVREQVLRRTRQEVPHAVEVEVEEIEERRDDLIAVRAVMWVEADSQKGILIGAGGGMIKAIGTAARKELERELGSRPPRPVRARPPRLAQRRAPADRLGIE